MVGHPGQSAGQHPGARRVIQRIRRRRRHRRGGHRLRHRHRRLGPHPGRLLRRGRPEDKLGQNPHRGVYPLAPSLDTVGPLGRDIAAVELGMRLLEPGFTVNGYNAPMTIGRLRPLHPALEIWPQIDLAIDGALAAAGFSTEDVTGVDFGAALDTVSVVIDREGYLSNVHLLPDVDKLNERNRTNMAEGAQLGDEDMAEARAQRSALREQLAAWLRRYPLLALPTLATPPPPLGERRTGLTSLTAPLNLAGLPALALPVPALYPDSRIPVSLQLVGPDGGEELLIAAGYLIEASS